MSHDPARIDDVESSEALGEEIWAYAPPPPSEELVDHVMSSVAGEAARRRRARRWRVIGGVAAAAAMVLAAFWLLTRDQVERGELRAIERTALALGDRATLEAEAGAELSYELDRGVARVAQHAGSVRYRVRPGGPFVVETPAGRVRVVGTEFQVEVSDMISRSVKTISAAGAVVIVTVAVYAGTVLLENDQGQVALAAGDTGWTSADEEPQLGASPDRAPAEPTGEARPATSEGEERPQNTKRARRFASREAREALARALEDASRRRREAARATTPQPAGEDPPLGRLSKEYIQDTVREAVPLIRECYEMALAEHAEQGDREHDLSGTLRVRFTIVGEPDVGGLVQEAEVEADEGLAVSETLAECVRETVYTLEFEPPEGGGEVIVTYPFRFSSSDGESDGPSGRTPAE